MDDYRVNQALTKLLNSVLSRTSDLKRFPLAFGFRDIGASVPVTTIGSQREHVPRRFVKQPLFTFFVKWLRFQSTAEVKFKDAFKSSGHDRKSDELPTVKVICRSLYFGTPADLPLFSMLSAGLLF